MSYSSLLESKVATLKRNLAAAEGERIALADALREALDPEGNMKTWAALRVQEIIDNAEPKS